VLKISDTNLSYAGVYYALVTNEFGSSRTEDFELSVIKENASETLDIPNITFSYQGEGFWFPQDQIVKVGQPALEAPQYVSGLSSIVLNVQGPISLEYFNSWGVNFHSDGDYEYGGDEEGEWRKQKIDLVEDREYEISWSNSPYASVGYLDGLSFFPLFIFEEDIEGTIGLHPEEGRTLSVKVSGNELTSYQWFKNDEPILGQTQPSINLNHDEVATGDRIFIQAYRGERYISSGQATILKEESPNEGDVYKFQYEGLTFYSQGNGQWQETDIEPTASGGKVLFPGIIPSDFEPNAFITWLYFLAEGPGVLKFRVLNEHTITSLLAYEGEKVLNGPDELWFGATAQWAEYTHRFREDGINRFNFESVNPSPDDYGGYMHNFLDDITFSRAPVLKEALQDVYVSLGSPFEINIDPVPVNGPVAISWYHDGIRLSEFDDAVHFSIDTVEAAHTGTYEVRLSEPGELESSESFEIFPIAPLVGVLNSPQENYLTSFEGDWDVVGLETGEGEFALVGDSRKGPRPHRLNYMDGRIFVSTGAKNAGILRLRMKVDRYFAYKHSYPIATLIVDGMEVWQYKFKTLDWVEHELEFTQTGNRRVELKFQRVSDGGDPSKLYLDEFSFTPDFLTSDAPKSKFVYLGDSVSYDLKAVFDADDPVSYIWSKDAEILKTSQDGQFGIPSIGSEDFGEYLLRIESEKGLIHEYPFQLVNASILNNALKAPDLKFFGEFTGQVQLSEADSPGHPGHLKLQFPVSEQPVSGSFSTYVQGPFSLTMDAAKTGGDLVEPLQLVTDGVEALGVSSEEWKNLQAYGIKRGVQKVDWQFSHELGEVEASVSLDHLLLDYRPAILAQSKSEEIVTGSPLMLAIKVSGTEDTEVQWYKDGQVMEGETQPYLLATAVGGANSGDYQLIAGNSMGEHASEPIQLDVQDDFGSVFPFQSWNWKTINKSYLSLDHAVANGGKPTVRVTPPMDSEIKPGVKFYILGPRTIELSSTLPGAQGNFFAINSGEWTGKSGPVSTVGWGRNFLEVYPFGINEVTIEFNNYENPSYPGQFDAASGWIGSIKAKWPKDSSITRWIKWALPYSWETITDFELMFGDEDGDGVQNIFEYATLSSAVTPGSNIRVVRGADGRDERITFYKPFVGYFPFTYALEASSNLVEWQRIPFIFEPDDFTDDSYKIFCRIRPDDDVVLPEGRCFLRLVVISDFYLPSE
jgi:hypothetical protein